MGQKINPTSLRIGIGKNWVSRWFFSGKGAASSVGRYPYAKFLAEDEAIRKVIFSHIKQAGIASIEVERTTNNLKIFIKAARPGFVIGQGGKGIETLTRAIERAIREIGKSNNRAGSRVGVSVNVEELKRSEVSATYVAQQIAWDLEKRMHFRRIMKKQIEQIMQNKEVRGAKLMLAGRLGGAEIAREEVLKRGALPLQTLRANIDHGYATAFTTYGTIGVKVWIYKGEMFKSNEK